MITDRLTIVILSNGPGELSTWVKPLADKLHQDLFLKPRLPQSINELKLVLLPCPNATGNEHLAAARWNHFTQIVRAKYFWKLLINPKRYATWASNGIVIFLGGDQFWSVLLSKRLINTPDCEE